VVEPGEPGVLGNRPFFSYAIKRKIGECAFQGSSTGHLFILCRVGLLVIGVLPVEPYVWHFLDALNSLANLMPSRAPVDYWL